MSTATFATPRPDAASEATRTGPRPVTPGPLSEASLGRSLLGLPLFLKVLVANCVVVLIGVGLGTCFTLTFVASPTGGDVHWAAVAVMLVVGFADSVLINAAVLTLAVQPLPGT